MNIAARFEESCPVSELRRLATHFDPPSESRKQALLQVLATRPLRPGPRLVGYCNLLMFLCAHPGAAGPGALAEAELARIASLLQQTGKRNRRSLENSGLPYTRTVCTYSHDLLRWLVDRPGVDVRFDSFHRPLVAPGAALKCTLPPVERESTDGGLSGKRLLDALAGPRDRWIPFLLGEFGRLDGLPLVKDHLFDGMHLYVALEPRDRSFSIPFNRIDRGRVYYHRDLLRQFDHRRLMAKRLPKPARLSAPMRSAVLDCARTTMVLLQRETDPTTYADSRTLRLYRLERGVSVAVYGMLPARQMPLESYLGYTLFKNGFPAAYGGGWVFGRRALIGINVFAQFRGGESGFMLGQLLRVFRQSLGVGCFEVEPYQYGEGNPEGIRSGAFWFYYRNGFRPVDDALRRIAEREYAKVSAGTGYKTPARVLRSFTASNLVLDLDGSKPPRVAELRSQVTKMIRDQYRGDRAAAEADCRRRVIGRAAAPAGLGPDERSALSEVSLWTQAAGLAWTPNRRLLWQMTRAKPADPYRYQRLLIELLR